MTIAVAATRLVVLATPVGAPAAYADACPGVPADGHAPGPGTGRIVTLGARLAWEET